MKPIDCCALGHSDGLRLRGRSFSGDAKQVLTLIKGAIAHGGTAVIDIVSPCVTFNNHEGSTKSCSYAKEHEEPLHELGFVPFYRGGARRLRRGLDHRRDAARSVEITLEEARARLRPDPRSQALDLLAQGAGRAPVPDRPLVPGRLTPPMDQQMNLVPEPLATLPELRLRPAADALNTVMDRFR